MNLILAAVLALSPQDFPDHTGFVNDFAGVIDEKSKAKLTEMLGQFAKDKDTHLIVVTVKSLGGLSVEEYTNKLFRKWGVGEKGKNNGILFLNAPSERKLRIEVGKGLEGRLTDIETKMILDSIVRPEFKAGRPGGGFLKGCQAVIEKMTATKEEPKEQAVSNSEKTPSGGSAGIILLVFAGGAVFVIIVLVKLSEEKTRKRRSTYVPSSYTPSTYTPPSQPSTYIPPIIVAPPPIFREDTPPPRRRSSSDDDSSSSSSWGSSSSSSSSSSDSGSSFSGGDSGGGGASSDY